MLSYLDYLVFLHVVFCTEQLYAFRRIIFSMFVRKKKLKITCPFCMSYRLTKMEDLQNALISRLFGVFAGGFLHRTTLCIPQNHFQHVFAKKKVENNLPILHGLQTYQVEDLQNALISRLFGVSHAVFCTEQLYAFRRIIFSMLLRKKKLKITCPFCMGYRLTKMEDLQNALISRLFGVSHAVFCTEQLYAFRRISFSMFLRKKKLKITCPFCMGYRLTKMEDLQNALISRLFGVFARGFLHRTTFCIPQNHFQHVFAKKKVENNLPILHGLQTYQNGGSSKCSHISTIWLFARGFLARNNSMHSVESFSACFCEKKS